METVAPLGLVVLQATRFCNLDCSYCYLPNRAEKGRMSQEVLSAVIDRLSNHPCLEPEITIVWHAGEPLAVGLPFYEDAIARFSKLNNAAYTHTIQTNGTLLTDDWCKFFAQHNIQLGVSIDGPKHIHDAARVRRDRTGTHDLIMRNVEMLNRHHVKYSVLSVVTKATLQEPEALFKFYAEHGLTSVGLLLEEIEGVNKQSSALACDDHLIGNFWSAAFRLAAQHGITVREIQSMVPRLMRQEFQHSQARPGHIITIGHTGDFSTYSPEILEQASATYGTFVIGNVVRDSFLEGFASPHNQRLLIDINKGIDKCRTSCDYFGICGGGFPSNKHSECGTFDAGETTYCNKFFKLQANAFLAELENGARL